MLLPRLNVVHGSRSANSSYYGFLCRLASTIKEFTVRHKYQFVGAGRTQVRRRHPDSYSPLLLTPKRDQQRHLRFIFRPRLLRWFNYFYDRFFATTRLLNGQHLRRVIRREGIQRRDVILGRRTSFILMGAPYFTIDVFYTLRSLFTWSHVLSQGNTLIHFFRVIRRTRRYHFAYS